MSRPGDFWTRRRAAVEAEAAAEQAAILARTQDADRAETDGLDDAEILARFDLPDPELLQPGDDVSGFMARAVPDHLRRRALRRLWRLNPVLANVDGLVDYGGDFTDSACVIENLQTAYQVGRGMLAHVEELARQAEAESESDPDPAPEDRAEAGLAQVEPQGETAAEAEPEQVATLVAAAHDQPAPPEPETDPPAPRRMRFAFEG